MLPTNLADRFKPDSPARRVTTLWLVMSVALVVSMIAFAAAALRDSFTEHKTFLEHMVESEIGIFQSVLEFNRVESADFPDGPVAAALSQFRNAHSEKISFNRTGEQVFGTMDGEEIVIYRQDDELRIPIGSDLAVPMQRALLGESGTMTANDYDGTRVLAAYAPIPETDFALVAKMDTSEVIGIELRAFVPVGLLALVILLFVTRISVRSINHVVLSFQENAVRFERAEKIGNFAYWSFNADEDEVSVSENMENILPLQVRDGKISKSHYLSLVHPDDIERMRTAFTLALDSAGEVDFVHRVIGLPGSKTKHLRILAGFGSESMEKANVVEGMLQDVTESETLNHRLEAQRKKHFDRLLYLDVGFVIYNPDTTLRFANHKAREMFHLAEVRVGAQGCEDPIWQFKHEDGTPMLPAEHPVSRLIEKGGRIQNELLRYPDAEGSRNRWLIWSGYVEHDDQNGVRHDSVVESVIVTYTDISATVSARESLEKANTSLRIRVIQQECVRDIQELLEDCPNVKKVLPDVVDSLDIGLGQSSLLRSVITIDEEFFGAHAAIGEESMHTIEIRPNDRLRGSLKLCFPPGERQCTDTSIENAIGFCELVARIVETAFEKETTVRRLTLLEASVQSTIEGVVITDSDGTIEWVNPAFEKITGYTSDELIGKNPRVLKSGIQPIAFYEEMWATLSTGQAWRGEFVNRKKSGDHYTAQVSMTPIIDETGAITHYVGVQEDITHVVDAEKQLRQAQKLEALGTLAGGIAHDFNNILSSIIGFSDLARGELDEDSQAYRDIGEVFKAGERARALIRQILTFSRGGQDSESIALQPHLVINEAMKLLRQSIPASVELKADLEKTDSMVKMDPTHLHQILMNLVTNAFQSLPQEKGRVSVSLAEVNLKEPVIGVTSTIPPGLYSKLAVRDDGAGIPEGLLRKIFDPFFTTKDVGVGTGLGLSTVLGIVEQAQGAITIESTEGEGSEFIVYIPAFLQEKSTQQQISESPRGNGERILIVDDQKNVCEVHRRLVENLGYTSTTFTSSLAALEAIKTAPQDFDLVLADYTMPDLSGMDLANELEKICPELPVIICSGRTELIDTRTSKHPKGISVIGKPVTVEELSRRLHESLSNQRNRES